MDCSIVCGGVIIVCWMELNERGRKMRIVVVIEFWTDMLVVFLDSEYRTLLAPCPETKRDQGERKKNHENFLERDLHFKCDLNNFHFGGKTMMWGRGRTQGFRDKMKSKSGEFVLPLCTTSCWF
jgi:hypothetical protein